MILPIALASIILTDRQTAFDQRLTVVQAVVRPSGASTPDADVPMRAVPILHRGDRVGIGFPTLTHTDWHATVAFYYQGNPLRWENEFRSATWIDLRRGDETASYHMAEAPGETPLMILAHEVDAPAERKGLINALRTGFPDLASTEAQMQTEIHSMTQLERLVQSMGSLDQTPAQKTDALKLMAAAADYQLDPKDVSATPAYWIQFMSALNAQRASGNPVDIESFGATLGQNVPPLARTILAAGNQIWNLIRTPKRVASYNFKWMPLYEDGDVYRCALPPIRESESSKTVLLAWLPVQNSTILPSLSLDSQRIRFGDTNVAIKLSQQSSTLLAMPEARQFRLKVGNGKDVYPLKSTGTNLVLDSASSITIGKRCVGHPESGVIEMQYGLDPVTSTPVTLEGAQSFSWTCTDAKSLEQLESNAPSATINLSPISGSAGVGSVPRVSRSVLRCGGEQIEGITNQQPNGTVSVQFSPLPKGHGQASISLYEDGLEKPDEFACRVFAQRPNVSRLLTVRGDHKCLVEGSGTEQIDRIEMNGVSLVRQSNSEFKSPDDKPLTETGSATLILSDGRSQVAPVQFVDPSPQFNVSAQVVGQVATPGLILPPNLVSADTSVEVSVDTTRPVLTGSTLYEVRQRFNTNGTDHGHVSMRAGATATTAVYHGPVRDFLPKNAVGKFDLRVVSDGVTSDFIPLTVQVGGKPEEIEVVDLPQITDFEVLPGKWRLYGTNLEFIRSISVDGRPLPVLRQSAYLELDGKLPSNAEVKLLDSNSLIGLTLSGLNWKNSPDFTALIAALGLS